ncbi:PREDICTED: uncharacterized protein LOC109465570 [Branchiostoma belcheri]|uniref:Uncharacterized protein LOC109465570 n=1 Tax=Branchiostoma belcheri TaxID=7741 RepID=A0A6P4YIA6_BRABE|nr:PREDICTED: uncharacterized protein LOC109465570 [Branchiostoma belcheri]
MHAVNDVNPSPMYRQSNTESIDPNKGTGLPCNQSPTDTHQQGDEAAFGPSDNDGNPCLQPYAVTLQQDVQAASIVMPEYNEDNPCSKPDAVKHGEEEGPSLGPVDCDNSQKDDDSGITLQTTRGAASKNRHTASITSDDEDIQPYAAAYMYECDMYECDKTSRDAKTSLSQNQNQPKAASNSINDVSTSPSSNDVLHALDPNPMYAAADMCQGDVGRNTTSGDTQASLSSQNQPAAASNSINDANDVLHALNPNPMYVPNVQHPTTCEKITFGGRGREAGKFLSISGVAVSDDSEIFVTDFINQRVQVFSMNGAYLRLFLTRVPGESRKMHMRPSSVAFDVDSGYLWVLGSVVTGHGGGDCDTVHGYMHVVQYSTKGQARKKFNPWFTNLSRDDRIGKPVIAIDTRNNKVIVGEGYTIRMFYPNGTLYRCFKEIANYKARRMGFGGIALDKKGNILLTDGHKSVKKYSPSGVKICEFGTTGGAKGRLRSPTGVCVDTSGRIIVANSGHNRVDMFTSRGEFVRTIVGMEKPWAIAMGPDGQLVVTGRYTYRYTVTIFPRRMVFT